VSAPVENLVERLHAKRSGDEWKANCPVHADRDPSLSISEGADGRALLKCWAGCETNDVLTAIGLKPRDLFVSGKNGSERSKQTLSRKTNEETAEPFNWQQCVDEFTDKHLERLAGWRGYSGAFVSWLHGKKLVGLYNGCVAFPVYSHGHVVAAHVRQKDGSWRYFPQGTKVRPLVIGELVSGDPVHCFESQWDAFAFMEVSGERSGIIITRGASNGALVADVIPKQATIYVWPQNDGPGQKWQRDVCSHTKCAVKSAKTPSQFADLNDWTRGGATSDDLLQAMIGAEILREAELSWTDALNAAVVTSSELHDLELVPRKKLLGDWFCEGDLGFIFAFRGVGKTWLALAIAQALSTGRKLGDWQAHEPVKVLYVDGEMPLDLIRDRCEGLNGSNAGKLEFLNHEILFERTGKVLNITKPEVQEAITQRCVKTGSKVLILDNLSTLASGMRENEADSWELVNNWLLDLRRRKIAVIIIHHAGRSGEMRGTSKREDNVFWIIALDDAKGNAEHKRGARFVSRFTKPSRNTQEDVAAYEWHVLTEPNGEVSISHKLAQTLDVFLGLVGDGVNDCGAIAQEMKISKASVSRMAKQAEGARKIIIKSRRYFLEEGAKNDTKK